MMDGGLLPHRPYVVVGPSGTGKTTLALQFLCEGVRRGEAVLLVTLEEPPNEARWNHRSLLPYLGKVHVFDAIPDVMRYERAPYKDIASVRASVPFDRVDLQIRQTPEMTSVEVTITGLEQMLRMEVQRKAYTRIVVDSLTALQYFCMKGHDTNAGAQTFLRFLSDLQVTTLLTVESPLEDIETPERMLARGEVRLFRWEAEGVTVRAVGVEKFRGSSHDIRMHPYRIGPNGIDINLNATVSRDTQQIIKVPPTESPGADFMERPLPELGIVELLAQVVHDLSLVGGDVTTVRTEAEAALTSARAGETEEATAHLTRAMAAASAPPDADQIAHRTLAPPAEAALARILTRAETTRMGVAPIRLPEPPILTAQLGKLLKEFPAPLTPETGAFLKEPLKPGVGPTPPVPEAGSVAPSARTAVAPVPPSSAHLPIPEAPPITPTPSTPLVPPEPAPVSVPSPGPAVDRPTPPPPPTAIPPAPTPAPVLSPPAPPPAQVVVERPAPAAPPPPAAAAPQVYSKHFPVPPPPAARAAPLPIPPPPPPATVRVRSAPPPLPSRPTFPPPPPPVTVTPVAAPLPPTPTHPAAPVRELPPPPPPAPTPIPTPVAPLPAAAHAAPTPPAAAPHAAAAPPAAPHHTPPHAVPTHAAPSAVVVAPPAATRKRKRAPTAPKKKAPVAAPVGSTPHPSPESAPTAAPPVPSPTAAHEPAHRPIAPVHTPAAPSTAPPPPSAVPPVEHAGPSPVPVSTVAPSVAPPTPAATSTPSPVPSGPASVTTTDGVPPPIPAKPKRRVVRKKKAPPVLAATPGPVPPVDPVAPPAPTDAPAPEPATKEAE